jgi:hypothetical protein
VTGFYGQTGIQGVTGLVGGTGIQGVTGFYGQTGIQGVTGLIGGTGIQGGTGILGQTGIMGMTGISGTAGSQGVTGIAGQYWRAIPGTVVRTSNTQFTVTDTGNASKYDLLLSRGTVIKFTDSTAVKHAMVHSSSYATNNVTVNLIGDVCVSWDFTAGNFLYATEKSRMTQFSIPGTQAALVNAAGTFYAPYVVHPFGADIYNTTAGSGLNDSTYDINAAGTSFFTTKPWVKSGDTSRCGQTADNQTLIQAGTAITVDIDATSVTAPIDAWVYLYFTPERNQYL